MKKTINLPQNYLDAMKELLKEDYEDYLASFEEKRLYGLRTRIILQDCITFRSHPQ